MDNNILVTEARLDWLTVTCKRAHDSGEMMAVGREMVGIEKAAGNFRRPFAWRGYVGEHCGAVTYGEREDGALCQLTGWAASQWFDRVYKLADNVTRADVCVTARYPEAVKGVAGDSYDAALAYVPSSGIRPSSRLIVGSDGGATFYLGAPSSDCLARCYDKSAESPDRGDYARCWRWECQYKSQLASDFSRAYDLAADRPSFCQGIVYRHYTSRGVSVPFDATCNGLFLHTPRAPIDAAKRLAWLQATVRPVITRLMDVGCAALAARALGFADEVCIVADALHGSGAGHHSDELNDETT